MSEKTRYSDAELEEFKQIILEKLEKYVKCKMYQILKKGSTINKGSRMSQIVE